MLAIHRAVSGESTWDKPFEVTGLDDRTFAWTHRGIAEYLSNQWAGVPHGPHCENTKSWPFCLSAAGLGLQLTDLTVGTKTHWVYDRWVEEAFKKKYMGFDQRGRLKWVAFYYDPLLDRIHGNQPSGRSLPFNLCRSAEPRTRRAALPRCRRVRSDGTSDGCPCCTGDRTRAG